MIRGIAIPGVQVHIIQEAEVTQEAGVLDEAIAARAEGLVPDCLFHLCTSRKFSMFTNSQLTVYLLGVNTIVALCMSHPQGLFPLLALFQGTFLFHIKVHFFYASEIIMCSCMF